MPSVLCSQHVWFNLQTTFEHTPMLLVPCGHTLCKHCSASHSSCRLCGTRVASLTTNIMLQQIIREFHCKSLQGVSVAHRSPSEPIQWERQRGMPLIPPKTTTKHHDGMSRFHALSQEQYSLVHWKCNRLSWWYWLRWINLFPNVICLLLNPVPSWLFHSKLGHAFKTDWNKNQRFAGVIWALFQDKRSSALLWTLLICTVFGKQYA